MGAAAALPETSNQLGGALGVAILGSIGAAVYTRDIADSTSGLPPEAEEAAEGSLGGAHEVAGHLPADAGDSLVQAAGEAFTRGMNLSAAVGGAVMLVGAVGAALLLRHVKTPDATDETKADATTGRPAPHPPPSRNVHPVRHTTPVHVRSPRAKFARGLLSCVER